MDSSEKAATTSPAKDADAGASGASLDQQTLMSLLKEKAKELHKTQKKLNKVEEKFVTIHKKEKSLMKDRDTFMAFLVMVFPEDVLQEVLLPEDQYGLYDIEHLKQFWLHQKSKQEAQRRAESGQLEDDFEAMKRKLSQTEQSGLELEEIRLKMADMEKQKTEDEVEIQSLRSQVNQVQLSSAEVQRITEERDKLQEKIRKLEADNSESQAKLLMNAFGGASGNSGLGGASSLLGASVGSSLMGASTGSSQKVIELEKQVSDLTNDYLQLREENQGLKDSLNELQQKSIDQASAEQTHQVDGQSEVANEQDLIDAALKPHLEEKERIMTRNTELEQKLQSLLTEYAVMKSDCEIIKTKARQMLIEKDEEIEKIKTGKRTQVDLQPNGAGQGVIRGPVAAGDSGASNFQEESSTTLGGKQSASAVPQRSLSNGSDGQFFQGILPAGLDKSYVRNILLKYLEYMAAGEEKEALTLEKVLFTVLEATPDNLESLEKSRARNNGGFFSYFYTQPSQMVAKPLTARISSKGTSQVQSSK